MEDRFFSSCISKIPFNLEIIRRRFLFLGLLKKIQRRRKDLRVIVCSATLDAQQMVAFFNLNATEDASLDTVAVLAVPGRSYSLEVHYLKGIIPS